MKTRIITMKIYLFMFLLTGSMLIGGCEKALDEDAKTFIAPDKFFTNGEQCTQAVNGVYGSLNTIYGSPEFWRIVDLGTDLSYTEDANNLIPHEYTFTSGNTGTGGIWSAAYTAIKNANMVVNRVSQAPIDEQLKGRLVGEAKFLRALYYFILSNFWGDVPLWTDELNVDAVSQLARTPLVEVRAQIVKDLSEAAETLPLSYGTSDVGRATKGAALTLLAKVYLYNKEWTNAQQTALQVVQSGQYSLLPNYADVFDVHNRFKNNAESIFEVQFLRDAATATNIKTHQQVSYYMPARDPGKSTYAGVDFGNYIIDGWSVCRPTLKLAKMFEPNDQRKDVVLGYGYNGQTFTKWPRPDHPWFGPKFWDLDANAQASGKNLYILRYVDVLLILAEAYNEDGNIAESTKWLNEVRKRAKLNELANPSQENLREEIMKERAIEFAGEFQRRWDLVRWNKLVEAVKSVADDNPIGAANIKPFHNYYPISAEEIIKNPNLTQNPGY
ncbi:MULTISPECIES: RagB/SusD family nutrient uptake outer membrane protein [Olivibacter]|uniref:RagB/SusD family nutrient uptake outer membrane protein n=1 Tax=Olivibacter jilunii TaxID=985016 RepID=A0ABW6B8L9_9SPHI|nr:RagB/SusD family nutrient uptake outer membrane protein [Olivibacter sp. UJ_SKK_5.1]MDX3915980.1 RagB/SusD family nutrient uptake outer membrane protein [Pseudosphingobacterium sp.]